MRSMLDRQNKMPSSDAMRCCLVVLLDYNLTYYESRNLNEVWAASIKEFEYHFVLVPRTQGSNKKLSMELGNIQCRLHSSFLLVSFSLLSLLLDDCKVNAVYMECKEQQTNDGRRSLHLLSDMGNKIMVFTKNEEVASCIDHECKISVFMDTHMYLIADPVEDETSACPLILFHQAKEGKTAEMLIFTGDAVEDAGNLKYLQGGIFLAKCTLEDIADAFEYVELDPYEYDVVMNNCASFCIRMMGHLGVLINDSVIEYVSHGLFENNHTIRVLRNNPNAEAFLGEEALALEKVHLVVALVLPLCPGPDQDLS